jgi:hypothetical protein
MFICLFFRFVNNMLDLITESLERSKPRDIGTPEQAPTEEIDQYQNGRIVMASRTAKEIVGLVLTENSWQHPPECGTGILREIWAHS